MIADPPGNRDRCLAARLAVRDRCSAICAIRDRRARTARCRRSRGPPGRRQGRSRQGPEAKPKAKAKAQAAKPRVRRDPPGFYMGRPIADVMSWEGADWLFRETRIEEEQPEAMLDALKIPRGRDRGRRRRRGRLSQHPPGPAGRPQGDGLRHRRPARDAPDAPRQRPRRRRRPTSSPSAATQTDTKLPEAAVDLILMVDVYHECSDPETTLQGLCKALKPARPAGPGRVPRRGPRGPDQARAQDDPRAGPPRGRAPGLHLQGVARIPPLAARHHLREAGRGRKARQTGRTPPAVRNHAKAASPDPRRESLD